MLILVLLSQVDDNPFQRRTEYGDIEELAQRIAAPDEPTEELTMTELATEWLRSYEDKDGRTWSDLTASQTHHANSPCYQAFVAAFPAEPEPKWHLKQARARLERETAVTKGDPA